MQDEDFWTAINRTAEEQEREDHEGDPKQGSVDAIHDKSPTAGRQNTGNSPGETFDARKGLSNGKEDNGDNLLNEILLRRLISEIIRKCGDDWCLYTKKKNPKTGRRRRLGTHSSKDAAYRQERAIKAHGG